MDIKKLHTLIDSIANHGGTVEILDWKNGSKFDILDGDIDCSGNLVLFVDTDKTDYDGQ